MPSSLNRLLPGIRHPARSLLIPITKPILSRPNALLQNNTVASIPDLRSCEELHNARTDLIPPTGKPILSASIVEKLPTFLPYQHGSKFERRPYWQSIPRWKNITEDQFLSYEWNVSDSRCHETHILNIS